MGKQLVKNASHENKGCCERPLFEQRRKKEPEQLPRALSSISLLVELCDHEYSYLFVPDALITHFVFLPVERHSSYFDFFNSGKAFTSSLSILSSVFQTQTPASFDETRMLMEKPNT